MIEALQTGVLLLVGVIGAGVVLTHEPREQAVVLSLYGLCLSLLFFLFQAPDVALAQIVVGAVALPLMILWTLSTVRRARERREARP